MKNRILKNYGQIVIVIAPMNMIGITLNGTERIKPQGE